jgi:hypothetical protein
MQQGLDLEYMDPVTHKPVTWAFPTAKLLKAIRDAKWKVVDIETTGLNPASKEQNFSGKELRAGFLAELRVRVVSIVWFTRGTRHKVGFDFDQLNEDEKKKVCDAAMRGVVIGHNVGFDGYWLRLRTRTRPTLLLDSMLISRILRPMHPVNMARMCGNEEILPEIRSAAELMFMGGASGWSLAHLSIGVLGRIVDKERQGPKNWAKPFLVQEDYNYATGDADTTLDILLNLFGITDAELLEDPDLFMRRYQELVLEHPTLSIIEPQVMDVIEMREHGTPWHKAAADSYIESQWAKVASCAKKMVEMEPSLAPFEVAMANVDKGITADLKAAIGEAFQRRGIEVELTATLAFKIGEKDLRRAKAAITGDAKELFDTWVKLNKAKKAGSMARDFTAYAVRSGDERIHPNTGHGPVTGRLSSSEPNVQQMPRDQGFRDCVKAPAGKKIVASDYSALDMRVGAALAIRAQQQILDAYLGERKVVLDARRCIERVFEGVIDIDAAVAEEARALKAFTDWKERLDELTEAGGDSRKKYWERYRALNRTLLLAGFQRCLRYVRDRADEDGAADWGSLRDAFNIPGMDIHSWTALGMEGKDPKTMFAGLSDGDVAKALKKAKGELGDKRQTGKVGNLSLLYAMKTKGLMDAAAKNYNIHWTYEEADKVRNDWLNTYVEIDLWHKWTELNPLTEVYVPDPDRGMKPSKKQVYSSVTLGGRQIVAFGLNAALSYEDQSTGADILGRVMQTFREKHVDIFNMTINQVHDELVFEVPTEVEAETTAIIGRVMTECAEHFLMPFGIRGECSPAVGDVWVKD